MSGSEASPVVRVERRKSTIILWIDHPPINILSTEVLKSLVSQLGGASTDPDCRVIVLASSNSKAFAAGADIRDMASMGPEEARRHGSLGQRVTTQIEQVPVPVIAAVHGACLGGGCEIALACDFILAADDATFGQPEINLGIMPGWGGTQRLPRRIGAVHARRWILTGKPVSAALANEQGLVDELVPKADLLARALGLADELSSKAPLALAAAKYAIRRALDNELASGLDFELDLWARLFGSPGQREGMNAFLEKRPPEFRTAPRRAEESQGFPWA